MDLIGKCTFNSSNCSVIACASEPLYELSCVVRFCTFDNLRPAMSSVVDSNDKSNQSAVVTVILYSKKFVNSDEVENLHLTI